MTKFITRTKRDPVTGMIVQVQAEFPETKQPTVDDLFKEISTLKKALMSMIELEAENDRLKKRVAELEYRAANRKIEPIIFEPTKDKLIALVETMPELVEPTNQTSYRRNSKGIWEEYSSNPPVKRTRKKNPTT